MENASAIMKDGFKESSKGYLGAGVYGGYEDKARSFASKKSWHGGDEGALLKCRVTVDPYKVKTVSEASDAIQKNGQTAEAVWYPGGGSVKRPEVCLTNAAKIEVLSVEKVATKQSTNYDSDDE